MKIPFVKLVSNSTIPVVVQTSLLSKIYYEVGEVGRLFLGLTPWSHKEKQVKQVALLFSSQVAKKASGMTLST